MSSNGSKPAFPTPRGAYDKEGLNHREWLVGMAMNGLIVTRQYTTKQYTTGKFKESEMNWIVETSYAMADRILAKNSEGVK